MALVPYDSARPRGVSRKTLRCIGLAIATILCVAAWAVITLTITSLDTVQLKAVLPAIGIFILVGITHLLAHSDDDAEASTRSRTADTRPDSVSGPWGPHL